MPFETTKRSHYRPRPVPGEPLMPPPVNSEPIDDGIDWDKMDYSYLDEFDKG